MRHGRVIYVIGPSGCGKDSLMIYARKRCPGSEVAFAHRYITRAAEIGDENHVALHSDEFQGRLERGLFALNWDSHGFQYGIGHEIDLWLEAGFNVVVNGSRAYLPEAVRRYPDILPVLISVDIDILRQRLLSRGRETEAEIERRLERAKAYDVAHPNLQTIDNSYELYEAGENLLTIVREKPRVLKKAV